jgi:hypothetical protein
LSKNGYLILCQTRFHPKDRSFSCLFPHAIAQGNIEDLLILTRNLTGSTFIRHNISILYRPLCLYVCMGGGGVGCSNTFTNSLKPLKYCPIFKILKHGRMWTNIF